MSERPDEPATTGTDRWTKPDVTAGEDPREVERERRHPERAREEAETRHLTHDDEVVPADEAMGTTSDVTHPAPQSSDR